MYTYKQGRQCLLSEENNEAQYSSTERKSSFKQGVEEIKKMALISSLLELLLKTAASLMGLLTATLRVRKII